MQIRGRESGQIIVSASPDEFRLVLASLNEVLNGPYAVPDDDWSDLIGNRRRGRSSSLRASRRP